VADAALPDWAAQKSHKLKALGRRLRCQGLGPIRFRPQAPMSVAALDTLKCLEPTFSHGMTGTRLKKTEPGTR
jgi:hypothetical protein